MDAAFFRMLFDFNRAANGWVLAKAREVREADYFATAAGLSFGSLHATLIHILVAEIVWLARWKGSTPPAGLANARDAVRLGEADIPMLTALMKIWRAHEASQKAFVTALSYADVNAPLAYRLSNGEPSVQPLRELMAHVVTHGTQFRAEAAVRLSQLGLSPGDLDLLVYLRSVAGARNA